MYTVYVLENQSGSTYTGGTKNLQERLDFHNDDSQEKARFHRTTFRKGPWHVVYTKAFTTRREAFRYERYLKTGVDREWLEGARRGE